MSDDELDVEVLMTDYCRRIDQSQLPGGRTVIHFIFPGLAKFEHWWIVVDGDRDRELCTHHPGGEVDVRIRADLRALIEVWAGDTDLRAALKDGRLQVDGNPFLVRTMATWLRGCSLAAVRPHRDALKV
jgi:hypothetical protein